MAAKTNAFIDALLDLLFNNAAMANWGDASGIQPSGTPGFLYVSLHTASPGVTGNQTTSEATYTGYARIPIARSSPNWTRTGETVSPGSDITFGACTAGTNTITHWGLGSALSSTGHLMYFGTVTPNISVAAGITPVLTTASTATES